MKSNLYIILIIVIALTLLAAITVAQITVGTPVQVGTGYDKSGTLLNIPRKSATIRGTSGDTSYVIPLHSTTPLSYTDDEGATHTSVTIMLDTTEQFDIHRGVWSAGGSDGLHVFMATYTGTTLEFIYRYVAPPCTQASDREQVRIISDVPGSYRGTVVSDADSVWAVFRETSDATLFLRKSTDRFATAATTYDWEMDAVGSEHRVGLFTNDNGLPFLIHLDYLDGFFCRWWQGDGFYGTDADSVIVSQSLTGADRAFTVAYTDGVDLIYGRENTTDSLVHYHWSGVAWVRRTVSTTTLGGIPFYPSSGVRNDSLFCFYNISSVIVCKVFDGSTWSSLAGVEGDSTVVSGAQGVDQFTAVPYSIPTSMTTIPFWWVDASNVLWYNELTLEVPIFNVMVTE